MEMTDMKESFSQALIDLVQKGENIAVVDADLMRITGTTTFRNKYPERCFQVGIAEQNLVGIAAGLALMGRTVFASTFSTFISLRSADQVRNTVCYNNLNVKLCGTYAGITTEKNGGTHASIEDITIFRGIPSVRIIDAGDGNEFYQALHVAAETPGPFYLRISKGPMPVLFSKHYTFKLGKAVELNKGTDATLITSGLTTRFGMEACVLLAGEGISVRHLHMPTIKPLDKESIILAAQETGMLFVAENHSIIGGLGSAVAEAVCEACPTHVERMGITDEFCVGASIAHLATKYCISAESIFRRIRTALRR